MKTKRPLCARCGKGFDPEFGHHVMCGECWDVCGLFGDEASLKFWRMAFNWVNGTWTDEELKELADSPVGQTMVKEIISAMDIGMRYRLLKQEITKLQ